MNKSSTVKTSQLSTHSAWARGPPQNAAASSSSSPRSQSPATTPTTSGHQRKPSGLSAVSNAAVAVRPGAAAPAPRPASQVVFGSVDDPSATISSSPAPAVAPPPAQAAQAPPISTAAVNVKSFGSIPVTPATPASSAHPGLPNGLNGSSGHPSSASASTTSTAASTPAPSTPGTPASKPLTKPKFDVKSLFTNSGGPPPSSPTKSAPQEVSAPAPRHPPNSMHMPHPMAPGGGPQFAAFPPNAAHLRPGSSAPVPRSPQFNRAMPNGAPRPGGPAGPGAPPQAMGSPRLTPQQVPPQAMPPQPGMPPGTPMWIPQGGYPQYYYYPSPYMQQPPPGADPAQHPQPHWIPGAPPGAQPHMGAPPAPHAVASPRTQPPPLAVQPVPPPTSATPPVSSTPQPQTANRGAPTPMSPQAPSFVPRTTGRPGGSAIRITNPSGAPIQLPLKENGTPTSTPVETTNRPSFVEKTENRRSVIRIESPADKLRREEEEREKKRKEDEAKKAVEDARKKKEAEEKARKDEEERKKKAAEEAEAKEKEAEAARKKKEAEEVAAAEAKRKEDEERKRKEEEEAAARKKAEEEAAAESKRKDEEVKKAAEEEASKKKAEDEEKARKSEADAASAKVEEDKKEDDKLTSSPTSVPTLSLKPSAPDTRRRPGPINIDAARAPMTPGPMSALATARIITDINQIQYPENIKSPRIELNMNAKEGRFRYDRDFLMQFMEVCKEKPDHLPPPETLGLEPIGAGGAGDRRRRDGREMPPPMSRSNSVVGLGFGGSASGSGPAFNNKGGMGNFQTPGRTPSMGGAGAGQVPFPRPPAMQRTPSQGGPGGSSGRTRSQRGNKRGESKMSTSTPINLPVLGGGLEPVQALERSDNAWSTRRGGNVPGDSAEVVERKVKGLLNKLTMERFDSISDQIIDWANKSEKEKDGRTLIQVIRLVFEKATDEAAWSEMYARLCRKMMEQISPAVMDEGIRNSEGQPITGGLLFRKYLLNRCQEDFERGWTDQAKTAAAAAEKAQDDEAAKKSNENAQGGEEVSFSEEYYAAQKSKRRGLGLVRFIGELFKLQMLTERIMHECIKKLLSNVDNPGEEEIESICKLLTTVGQSLDTSKARSHMDIYFKRMRDLSESPNIDSRMKYMLIDVIELRARAWVPRNAVAAPTTLASVHEQAAKEKAAAEKENAARMSTMSRGGSRRGDNRSEYGSHTGADGWSTPAGRPPPNKVGDLSQFGKINKASPGVVNLGPSSVFAGKKGDKRDSASLSRSSSNPFAALTQNPSENAADAPTTSRSRKPSVDMGSASGLSDAGGGRRRLQLLPRSKPLEDLASKVDEKTEETPEGTDEEDAAPTPDESEPPKKVMSDAEVKKQIENDTKEFFAIKKLDEGEQYFESLPEDQRHKFVDSIFSKALEGKDPQATLAGELFAKVLGAGKITPELLEQGFSGTIEFLDDVAVDAPAAYALTAKMLYLSKFDEERVARLADKIAVEGDPLVKPKDKLLKEFKKLSS